VNFPFVPRDRHEQILAAERATVRHLTDRLSTAQADLAAARKQYTTTGQAAEDDARRKALADALGEDKQFYTWEQLLTQVAGLKQAGVEWMAEAGAERTRADGLQRVIDATRARRTQATDEESRPVDGGSMAPQSLASGLLREKGRADKLAARLAEVTAANQACTCAGGEQA
jgi:hypothetical protein